MKKLLTILTIFTTLNIFSQSIIITKGLTHCIYNNTLEDFTDCESEPEQVSMITISKDETVITQTIYNQKSIYFVTFREVTYNKDQQKVWHYEIIGESSKKYSFFVTPSISVINVIYFNDKDIMEGLIMPIKSVTTN